MFSGSRRLVVPYTRPSGESAQHQVAQSVGSYSQLAHIATFTSCRIAFYNPEHTITIMSLYEVFLRQPYKLLSNGKHALIRPCPKYPEHISWSPSPQDLQLQDWFI